MSSQVKGILLTAALSASAAFSLAWMSNAQQVTELVTTQESMQKVISLHSELTPEIYRMAAQIELHSSQIQSQYAALAVLMESVNNLRGESGRIVEALKFVAESNKELVKVVSGMQQQLTRLETREEIRGEGD